MPPINVISAAMLIVGFVLVVRAFSPLVGKNLENFGYFMMRGVVIGMVVGIARSGYWDFAQYFLDNNWHAVRTALGGQQFSTVFNLLALFAVRDFLKARLALIPENERHMWRWWTAWAHPGERCLLEWRKRE